MKSQRNLALFLIFFPLFLLALYPFFGFMFLILFFLSPVWIISFISGVVLLIRNKRQTRSAGIDNSKPKRSITATTVLAAVVVSLIIFVTTGTQRIEEQVGYSGSEANIGLAPLYLGAFVLAPLVIVRVILHLIDHYKK